MDSLLSMLIRFGVKIIMPNLISIYNSDPKEYLVHKDCMFGIAAFLMSRAYTLNTSVYGVC